MTTVEALDGLGSLAQQTRLEVFRLLVQRGPGGLSAGAIAEALDVPASSLSFHLQQLMHAGLGRALGALLLAGVMRIRR